MPATTISLKQSDKALGASGITLYGGIHRNVEEYNPDLRDQNGMKIYNTMRLSDGEVQASLARITLPLLSADWKIRAAEKGAKAEEIAGFVTEVLIKRRGYGTPHDDSFGDFIRHALLMLPFGFMAFEKVWGVDSKGRQVYAKIAPRLPQTFWEFEFDIDTNDLKLARQRVWTTTGFKTIDIPADKLVLFVFGREGDSYWGRSILRAAYKHWDMKDTIIWVGSASVERFGMGALELHATDAINDDQKAAAEESAKNFKSHESNYLFTPSSIEAKFHYPPSGSSQAIDWARYHDDQIAKSMMTEFMATGTAAATTGSRAVVSSKIDLMFLAMQGTAKIIADVTGRQLIEELVYRNYGVQEEYPTLVCEDLDKLDDIDLAEMVGKLMNAQVGALTPTDDIENTLRGRLKFDPLDPKFERKTPEEKAAMAPPLPVANGNGAASANGAGGTATKPGEKIASRIPASLLAADVEPYMPRHSRDVLPHEAHVDFGAMSQYLDTEPRKVFTRVVASIKEQMIRGLARQAANATDSELAAHRLSAPLQGRLADDLQKPLLDAYARGRKSVLEERARQLATADRPPIVMADAPADGPPATRDQLSWVKKLALAFAGTLGAALAKEAADEGFRARNAELPIADQVRFVEKALRNLSEPVQVASLAGTMTQAMTNGRNEQASALGEQIDTAYYSAVMDSGTCGPCAELDGAEHDPTDETYATPNPNCEGGENCRCVTVYVFRDQAMAASDITAGGEQ